MKHATGETAGFVATVVLSAIMLMKSAMGLMPQLNVIQMLTEMGANYIDLSGKPGNWLDGPRLVPGSEGLAQ